MVEKACAYIVLEAKEEFNFSEMEAFLKKQGIAPFKIPERLEIIDNIPLVGGIKMDKKRLKEDIKNKLRQEVTRESC